MSQPVNYNLTNESITVVHGGNSHVVRKDTVNFRGLRDALINERWDEVPKYLTVAQGVETWATQLGDDFTVRGGTVYFKDEALPTDLNSRIVSLASAGKSPVFLTRFWRRLQNNPSWRSVQQLFPFLEHQSIPIDEDGCILAYKAVNADYTDCHTGKVNNRPGVTNEMPRNRISDDPKEGCHYGFHVGAIAYARSFGPTNRRLIICKVDPADVVCVPFDAGFQKMRVCKYEVIGHYGADLPDAAISRSEVGVPAATSAYDPEDDDGVEDETCGDCGEDIEDCTCEDEEPETAPKAAPKPKAKVEKTEKTEKAKQATSRTPNPELDGKDEIALLECDLDTLRKYAANDLLIVGASKIPGGKRALVQRIIDVRR